MMKNRKIEIHIIQSFPVTRLNSDRDGMIKTIQLGGTQRARISSQAFKRAARMYTHEHGLLLPDEQANRTRRFTQLVGQELETNGLPKNQADDLALKAITAIGMGHRKKEDVGDATLNEYSIFFAEREMQGFVAAILKHRNALEEVTLEQPPQTPEKADSAPIDTTEATEQPTSKTKQKKTSKKQVSKALFSNEVRTDLLAPFKNNRSLEVALYGRQLVDLPDGRVDGQVQVAHAIGVSRHYNEMDFFVSVDDHAQEGDAQAAMLGETSIAAPTMYRMAAVNLAQLSVEIGSMELAMQAAQAFIEAITLAVPSGGKNSYTGSTRPVFVMLQEVVRGHVLTHAPAFDRPVKASDSWSIAENAIHRLDDYIVRTELAFPDKGRTKRVCVNTTNAKFDSAKSVPDLPSAIAYIIDESAGEA
jgi:CRISPR system Cascade subunit CasC